MSRVLGTRLLSYGVCVLPAHSPLMLSDSRSFSCVWEVHFFASLPVIEVGLFIHSALCLGTSGCYPRCWKHNPSTIISAPRELAFEGKTDDELENFLKGQLSTMMWAIRRLQGWALVATWAQGPGSGRLLHGGDIWADSEKEPARGRAFLAEEAAGSKATVPGAKCLRGEWSGRGKALGADYKGHVGSGEDWMISKAVGSHRRVLSWRMFLRRACCGPGTLLWGLQTWSGGDTSPYLCDPLWCTAGLLF